MIKLLSDFISNYFLQRGEPNGISFFSRAHTVEIIDNIEFDTFVLPSFHLSPSSIQFDDSGSVNVYLSQEDNLFFANFVISVGSDIVYDVYTIDSFSFNESKELTIISEPSSNILLSDIYSESYVLENELPITSGFYSVYININVNINIFDPSILYTDIVSVSRVFYLYTLFGDVFSEDIYTSKGYRVESSFSFYDTLDSYLLLETHSPLFLQDAIDTYGKYEHFIEDVLPLTALLYLNITTDLYENVILSTSYSTKKLYPVISHLSLNDYLSLKLLEFIKSVISDYSAISDILSFSCDMKMYDILLMDDYISLIRNLFINLSDRFDLKTVISILSTILKDIPSFYIYFDFYQPLRFSILELSALFGGDTVFCAYDGIYSLDYSTSQKSMLSINLSELQSSRMKRLDKIYSNVPLTKATIYADSKKYNLSGNSVFIPVPKGIRAKDYRVVIYNSNDIEFVDIGIVEERRPK